MKTRDLKKLKPGQKLYVKLDKLMLKGFPYLAKWHDRIVYFDHLALANEHLGEFTVRSSNRIRSSTSYEQL